MKSGRQRILVSMCLLVVICAGVGATAIGLLYHTAVEQEKARLMEIAQSHARLVEAICEHEQKYHHGEYEGRKTSELLSVVLEQLKSAHERFKGLGETGEFTVGGREGDDIVYLLRNRHDVSMVRRSVPWNSGLGQPMKLALSGKSGITVGRDYRGERVLAAHEPVKELGIGIVAKIDMTEVRAPFVRAGMALGLGSLLIALIGAALIFIVNNPTIQMLELQAQRLQREADELKRADEERTRLWNILERSLNEIYMFDSETLKFLHVNTGALKNLGYSLDEMKEKTPLDIKPEFTAVQFHALVAPLLSGDKDKQVFETVHERRDESRYPVEVHLQLVRYGASRAFVAVILDITERRKAEEALRQSEVKLRAIFENSTDAIGLSRVGIHTLVNPTYLSLFGYTNPGALFGKPILDLIAPGERERIREFIKRRAKGDDLPSTYETRGLKRDGTEFEMDVKATSYEQAGGVNTLVILRDITERKRMEKQLSDALDLNRKTLSTSLMGILAYRADTGECVLANEAAARMVGATVEQMMAQNFRRIGSWRESGLAEAAEATLADGEDRRHAIHVISTFGRDVWLDCMLTTFESNGMKHLMMMFDDIGGRKKAESELQVSKDFAENLIETANAMIVGLDADGKVTVFNTAAENITGYSREDLTGRNWFEVLVPKDRYPYVWAEFERLVEGGIPKNFENPIVTKSGEERYIMWQNNMMTDQGRFSGTISFGIDITERKRAEEARHESEERFRRLFDESPLGAAIISLDSRFLRVNQAMCRMMGYTEAELITKTFMDITHQDHVEESKSLVRRLLAGEADVISTEKQYVRKDGAVVWGRLTVRLMKDAAGNPAYFLPLIEDITERKRSEDELLKLRKIESVGLLAGGIAHDFNNSLAAILGGVDYASEVMDEDLPEAKDALALAKKAVYEARNLTQQLLTFSKGGAPVIRTASIADLLEDTCGFVLRGSSSRAELSIAPDLWNARIDVGQVSQVVQNLTLNADQAMPGGGVITIAAKNFVHDGKAVALLDAGKFVEVTVRDRGIGIQPEHLQKIFDPYFTTKPKGHGLGLASVYSIITKHGGHIVADSKPGEGSTFTFWLPASEEAPEAAVARKTFEKTKKSVRVLVMDDNDYIRDLLKRNLDRRGYGVVVTADGVDAVRAYAEAKGSGEPFDAVILDLTVPGGMGGLETLQKIKEIDPGVKAIVASGYASDPVMSDPRAHGFAGVAAKPYEIDVLCAVVEEVADR